MRKDPFHYHILIVEDNPGDYTLIEEFLSEQIAKVSLVHATTYDQASAILDTGAFAFHVILLDLSLPDKQGRELIEGVIKHPMVYCPVIVLTGYADIQFSIESISLGASDYLLKDDLNEIVLYKSLLYSIERRKQQQAIEESEKKYSSLFNLSPQPMFVVDCEKEQILQVNKAVVDHYGYTEKELSSMTFPDLLASFQQHSSRFPASEWPREKSIYSGTHVHVKKSGEPMDMAVYSSEIVMHDRTCHFVIGNDITESSRNEVKLTKAIIKTQDDERYDIGSELHDNICQILAATEIGLGLMSNEIADKHRPIFSRSTTNLRLALQEIRNLSHRLAPAFFDDTELEGAFLDFINSLPTADTLAVKVYFSEPVRNTVLLRDLKLNLYRILQEQVNNIIKYAEASVLDISLVILDSNLKLTIKDDGKGFDTNLVKGGIGLANMKRRAELFAGNFSIKSNPDSGCEVIVSFPMDEVVEKSVLAQGT